MPEDNEATAGVFSVNPTTNIRMQNWSVRNDNNDTIRDFNIYDIRVSADPEIFCAYGRVIINDVNMAIIQSDKTLMIRTTPYHDGFDIDEATKTAYFFSETEGLSLVSSVNLETMQLGQSASLGQLEVLNNGKMILQGPRSTINPFSNSHIFFTAHNHNDKSQNLCRISLRIISSYTCVVFENMLSISSIIPVDSGAVFTTMVANTEVGQGQHPVFMSKIVFPFSRSAINFKVGEYNKTTSRTTFTNGVYVSEIQSLFKMEFEGLDLKFLIIRETSDPETFVDIISYPIT